MEIKEEMGILFMEKSSDLIKLDTGDIMDTAVTTSICQDEEIGQQQCNHFVKERLVDYSTSILEPLKTRYHYSAITF